MPVVKSPGVAVVTEYRVLVNVLVPVNVVACPSEPRVVEVYVLVPVLNRPYEVVTE